jgi:hypothetical protein
MADTHNPWLAGGLAFAGGFLAHYLLQRYEHDISGHLPHLHHTGAASSASSSSHQEVVLPLPLRDTKNNPRLETDTLNRKQNLEHVKFAGKRVLMRVDYNVKIVRGQTRAEWVERALQDCAPSDVLSLSLSLFSLFAVSRRAAKSATPLASRRPFPL